MDLGLGPSAQSPGHTVMAVQDLNNDKHPDLVTLSQAQDAISVLFFNPDTSKYTDQTEFTVPDGTIRSVTPTKSQSELQGLMLVVDYADRTEV